ASHTIALTQGLRIRGAPQGDGVGRVLAREVRELLGQGAEPGEMLILFPEWNDEADVARETLQDWGLPVEGDASHPLGADPAIAALLSTINLPCEEWATDRLIQVLRNRQIRPDWPGTDSLSLAAAASIIATAHVFRGREPLERSLDRTITREQRCEVKAQRARLAREVVGRVFALLAPLDQARPYSAQVDQLFGVAAALHIGEPDAEGLDQLRDALEDKADALH